MTPLTPTKEDIRDVAAAHTCDAQLAEWLWHQAPAIAQVPAMMTFIQDIASGNGPAHGKAVQQARALLAKVEGHDK